MDKVKRFYDEIEETVNKLLNEAQTFNGLAQNEIWNLFVRVGRIGFQLQQIAIKQTNPSHTLSASDEKRRDELHKNAGKILVQIGLSEYEFGLNARYSMIRIKLPNGESNGLDGLWHLPEAPYINV